MVRFSNNLASLKNFTFGYEKVGEENDVEDLPVFAVFEVAEAVKFELAQAKILAGLHDYPEFKTALAQYDR